MSNKELAKIFYEMADLLELAGVEWRPRAYRKAASSIEALKEDIKKIYKRGELEKIEGVGENLAEKITQYIKTGKISQYESLKGATKGGVREILEVTSMGPKKAIKLYQELGIKDLKSLERAAKLHKIRKLPGFGAKSEADILQGIKIYKSRGERLPFDKAEKIANELISELRKTKLTNKIIAAGSLRRRKATIGDIDLLATSTKPEKLILAFTKLKQVKTVLAKGSTKAMVVLKNGIQVDIRVVDDNSYGAALLYFTGDKQFNIELRRHAIRLGYKLSEYGLFDRKTNKKLAGKTELEIFRKLGYDKVIPPTARARN